MAWNPFFSTKSWFRQNVKTKITLHLLKERKPRYIISWLDVFECTLEECLQNVGIAWRVYSLRDPCETSHLCSTFMTSSTHIKNAAALSRAMPEIVHSIPLPSHFRGSPLSEAKIPPKKHLKLNKKWIPLLSPLKKKRTICAIAKGWTSSTAIPWCMHLCICPPGSTIHGSITLLERRETTALARRHSRSLAQYLDHMHRVTPAAPMPNSLGEMSVWQNAKTGWVGKNWDLIFHNAWWVRLLQKILEHLDDEITNLNLLSTSWKMDPKKAAFLVSVLLWRC